MDSCSTTEAQVFAPSEMPQLATSPTSDTNGASKLLSSEDEEETCSSKFKICNSMDSDSIEQTVKDIVKFDAKKILHNDRIQTKSIESEEDNISENIFTVSQNFNGDNNIPKNTDPFQHTNKPSYNNDATSSKEEECDKKITSDKSVVGGSQGDSGVSVTTPNTPSDTVSNGDAHDPPEDIEDEVAKVSSFYNITYADYLCLICVCVYCCNV